MEDHTFVIPVYQESPYLEECVQSLVGQIVKSKIIMTTSTPSVYSQGIARQYNIPYFINDKYNLDVAANWNFALSKADTKLVTIAHQDDVYESNFVQEVIRSVNLHRANDWLIAFTDYIDVVNGVARSISLNAVVKNIMLFPLFFSGRIKNIFTKKLVLAFGNPICCPAVTFNKEAIAGFKFKMDYRCVLDWYAWYELAKQQGSFLFVRKKLVKRRLHLDSGTSQLIINGQKKEDELHLFEMIWGKRFARLISKIYMLSYKDNML